MAEVLDRNDNSGAATTVAWVGLIVAVIALVLAWAAYNRTGEDLETQVQQGVEQSADEARQGTEEAGQEAQQGADQVEQGVDTGPDGQDDGRQ